MCEADSLIREPTVSRGEFKPDHSLSDSDTLLRVSPLGGAVSVAARRIELNRTSIGEFDPGSGRTLAACLTHASQGAGQPVTGERVRNT